VEMALLHRPALSASLQAFADQVRPYPLPSSPPIRLHASCGF
jgi:hypothetical protein